MSMSTGCHAALASSLTHATRQNGGCVKPSFFMAARRTGGTSATGIRRVLLAQELSEPRVTATEPFGDQGSLYFDAFGPHRKGLDILREQRRLHVLEQPHPDVAVLGAVAPIRINRC